MAFFDDMLSSSRGPGVIGTLLAMLVLVGFGGLYFLVEDDSGDGITLEGTIRQEGRKLLHLEALSKMQREKAEKAPRLREIAAELAAVKEDYQEAESAIAINGTKLEETKAELATLSESFDSYQAAYRNQIRTAAKGTVYPEIKTRNGRIFKDVTVLSVDAVGMSFRYEDGSSRADFEDLPISIQEQFQYDPGEKAKAREKEKELAQLHSEQTDQALAEQAQKAKKEAESKRAQLLAKSSEEFSVLESAIAAIDSQISKTERDWALDKERGRGVVDGARYSGIIRDLKTKKAAHVRRMAELKKIISEGT
jgi:chromosome segregation ATPase